MQKWLCLLAGSVAGGFARYGLAGFVHSRMGAHFPYGTMAANLCGCFLVGLFNGLAEGRLQLGINARVLLMTGFCGAFTTFSTLMLETSNLLKGGDYARAGLNVGFSLLAGFALFHLGSWAGEAV